MIKINTVNSENILAHKLTFLWIFHFGISYPESFALSTPPIASTKLQN